MNAAIASQGKHNVIFLQLPYLVQSTLFIYSVFFLRSYASFKTCGTFSEKP